MTVTVEPSISMPGKFGVHIEDTVIVGEQSTAIHEFTKELVRV